MASYTNTITGFKVARDLAASQGRAGVAKTYILVTDGAPNYPCQCSECTAFYGNQNNCTRPEWPGKTCNDCTWDVDNYPDSATYPTKWCMPCADFRSFAKALTFTSPYKSKVVTIGIGTIGALGNTLIQQTASTPSAAFFPTDWTQLNNIYQQIVDESC